MINNKVSNFVDIMIGLIVIVVASAIFFNWSSKTQNGSKLDSYTLLANFSDISGILIGSKVKISGITVGHVSNCWLDMENYSAIVEIKINKNIAISSDSAATISSDGIMDQKYIKIIPSSNDQSKALQEGEYIQYTQPPITLEALIEYLKP